MATPEPVLRIHPAIGMARVGNTDDYYLGPETVAGLPVPGGGDTVGGLPIRPGTERDTITSSELRDKYGALKRQGARFRLYAYPGTGEQHYPTGGGEEITVGSSVGGRRVVDILWTVHLANKKANNYYLNDELGMAAYEPAHADTLQLRNIQEGSDPNNAARLRKLVIDPGPRAIRGTDAEPVRFDKPTLASYVDRSAADGSATIRTLPSYPKQFPDDAFAKLYTPAGKIETLGELRTDDQGRLIVLGGYGVACGWLQPNGEPYPLIGSLIEPGIYGDVNANGWLDDTGDGPVSATVVFDDGSTMEASQAWAISTDPSYAPQTLNVVSLWDDVYDTWVRKLNLRPDIYRWRFQDDYRPHFDSDLHPLFRAVSLQRWTTNLPARAIAAHDAVGAIGPGDDPAQTVLTGLAFVRDPNQPEQNWVGAPFMPLSMGDAGKPFLTVSLTQYFFLTQWNRGHFTADVGPTLGPGEALDRAVLANCLGGRFAPGIEMTFIIRDPELWRRDWQDPAVGPFRIRALPLNYADVQASQPFLSVGYVPMHAGPDGLTSAMIEPGDVTKFMAIPWQTDYNSCATHNQAPNPHLSSTLYWSWPAQRPVQVHVADQSRGDELGPLRYSVRGKGTWSDDVGEQGRFQELINSVLYWDRIGFVIQGTAIDGDRRYPADQFLEVESRLDEPEITPWPMNSTAIGT